MNAYILTALLILAPGVALAQVPGCPAVGALPAEHDVPLGWHRPDNRGLYADGEQRRHHL